MGELLRSFNEGGKEMKELIGIKGANLSEMAGMGLPVPFGFTVTTETCRKFYEDGNVLGCQILDEIRDKVGEIEEVTGKKFGGGDNPLLVSVRPSTLMEIPAMADTVLNVGMNDKSAHGLADIGGYEFAFDSYTRFLRTYGSLVRKIPSERFIKAYGAVRQRFSAPEAVLYQSVQAYKEIIEKESGLRFSEEPYKQLEEAICAVFEAWNSPEAVNYRELHEISGDGGIAVIVQAMAYGNIDDNSCSGTVFTRDPNTGEKITCGEFTMRSQGGDNSFKDVRTLKISSLEDVFPELYDQFMRIAALLENYNKDMQEIEFTVEKGKLYMLETKPARRSPKAAVKIAVEMVNEKIIDRRTAVANIRASDINNLVLSSIRDEEAFDGETLKYFKELLEWADEFRTMGVRANIDTPEDARLALKLGADGIGLCRTEHMFFEKTRMRDFAGMMLAESREERSEALKKLTLYQREDFKEIFRIMDDRPVTIRLLDPSPNRFMPRSEKERKGLAERLNISEKKLKAQMMLLEEENPEMGARGSRLAVMYPDIVRMQTRALIEAAYELNQEGIDTDISIMVPFVSSAREFAFVRKTIEEEADACFKRLDISMDYLIGTMIETPRAALLADVIAEKADFFSIGTNDLTELVYGLSKEDTENLIDEYIRKSILDKSPFQSIDQVGVGKLIKMTVEMSRRIKPKMRIGICGEQAGDHKTIEFCDRAGLNYVSCSALRIPGARLASAQAEILKTRNK